MIDAYKIGVHLGFSSNGMGVMGLLGNELHKLHGAAKKAEEGFSALKLAAIGATSIVAGAAGLKTLWHMVEAAKELNHELVKIKIGAGLSDADVAAVRTDAYDMVRRIPGVKVEDAPKVERELFGTFGDMKEAHDALPAVLRANVALSRYGDNKTDVAQVAIRALEMRGHIGKDGKVNPEEFQKELDSLTRSIIASEGLLKPNDYLQAIRQAGPAATAMDADAFWGKMPAAMVGMGSQKSGTALMSLYSQIIGHVVAGKRIAVAMQDAGILKPGSWTVEKGGHVLMKQDAVVRQNDFAHDPFTYIHDMLERMKTHKGADGKQIDSVGIIQKIFQLSSRQTSARLINDIGANWSIFVNEQARYTRAPNAEAAANTQNKEDLGANVDNLQAAWHNLKTAFGEPGVPIAIDLMQKLTHAINDITIWASTHGDTIGTIEKVAGGLSVLAIGLGTLAVGGAAATALAFLAGPVGLVVLAGGIATLGAAYMAYKWAGWSERLAGMLPTSQQLASGFKEFAHRILFAVSDSVLQVEDFLGRGARKLFDEAGTQIMAAIAPLAGRVIDGLRSVTAAILEWIGGLPAAIGGAISGAAKSALMPHFSPNDPNLPGNRRPGSPGSGATYQPQSFVPPPQNSAPHAQPIVFNLDGRKIGEGVIPHMAQAMNRPPGGRTGFDLRMGPAFGGPSYAT